MPKKRKNVYLLVMFFLIVFKKYLLKKKPFSFSGKNIVFKGFSLLETAVALCISGIMMGSFISLFHMHNALEKTRRTEENKEKILRALGAFFTENGYLPCPGDPSASEDNMGVSRKYCPGILAQGIVPFRILGLSEDTARDGYRHLFTYSMEGRNNYSNVFLISSVCRLFFTRERAIEISDSEVSNIVDFLDERDGIAIVLISHGPKGYGAFFEKGSLQRIPLPLKGLVSGCKKKNIDGSNGFCCRPRAGDLGLFDDQVFWITRRNFMVSYTGLKLRCSEQLYNLPQQNSPPPVTGSMNSPSYSNP